MTLIEWLTSAGLASPTLIAAIQELEQEYPDAAPLVDKVLGEIAGVFDTGNIGQLIPAIFKEAGGIKGGFIPVHHASDGGA